MVSLRSLAWDEAASLVPSLRRVVYPHHRQEDWAFDAEEARGLDSFVLEDGALPLGFVQVSQRETTFAWPRSQCDPSLDLFEDPEAYDALNASTRGPCLYLDDIALLPQHRSIANFLTLLKAALDKAASLGLPLEASLRDSTTGRLRRSPVAGWDLTARVRKLRHCGFRSETKPDEYEPYTLIRLERRRVRTE